MDVDFYRYFIGREDQSVNEKVMIKRLDQQIFVTKTMIDMYQLKDIGIDTFSIYNDIKRRWNNGLAFVKSYLYTLKSKWN